jgi:repressor LexA
MGIESHPRTPTMDDGLTERQREVFDAIVRSIAALGFPPTVRELGVTLGVNSPNGMMYHLKALQRKGFIARDHDRARGIRVLKGGPAPCPHCGGTGIAPPEPETKP